MLAITKTSVITKTPVILSEVLPSRSEGKTQSKDPYPTDTSESADFSLWAKRTIAVIFLLITATQAQQEADRVLVLKHQHILKLLNHNRVLKEYKVALGGSPVGPKTEQGDHKTPEGLYVLDSRNAKSQFYKSLHISYPTPTQRKAARKHGVSPGGDVFIHGLPPRYRSVGAAHRLYDWTNGCIAVTDQEMDEIWQAVDNGTPIEIRP